MTGRMCERACCRVTYLEHGKGLAGLIARVQYADRKRSAKGTPSRSVVGQKFRYRCVMKGFGRLNAG